MPPLSTHCSPRLRWIGFVGVDRGVDPVFLTVWMRTLRRLEDGEPIETSAAPLSEAVSSSTSSSASSRRFLRDRLGPPRVDATEVSSACDKSRFLVTLRRFFEFVAAMSMSLSSSDLSPLSLSSS